MLLKASEAETFKPEPPKLAGTFVWDYMAPERWSDRLEIGDFRQERVRIEKQIWTKKSHDFVPLQVDQFFKALFTTTFQMVPSDVVNRVHYRKLEGTEARCIEFRNTVGRKSTDGEICVDRAAGTVVYWKYGQIEIWYSNYVPFSGRVRPSHFVVAEQGTPSVEGDVTYTLASDLSADSFSPLKDAEVQDVCSSSRALIAKHTPDPFFPARSVRQPSIEERS